MVKVWGGRNSPGAVYFAQGLPQPLGPPSPESGCTMQTRYTISPGGQPQRWLRFGSVLISFAAITLLATAFGARLYSGSVSSVLLTVVLIALCTAIVLHVRFLLLARREHRETANALDRRFVT